MRKCLTEMRRMILRCIWSRCGGHLGTQGLTLISTWFYRVRNNMPSISVPSTVDKHFNIAYRTCTCGRRKNSRPYASESRCIILCWRQRIHETSICIKLNDNDFSHSRILVRGYNISNCSIFSATWDCLLDPHVWKSDVWKSGVWKFGCFKVLSFKTLKFTGCGRLHSSWNGHTKIRTITIRRWSNPMPEYSKPWSRRLNVLYWPDNVLHLVQTAWLQAQTLCKVRATIKNLYVLYERHYCCVPSGHRSMNSPSCEATHQTGRQTRVGLDDLNSLPIGKTSSTGGRLTLNFMLDFTKLVARQDYRRNIQSHSQYTMRACSRNFECSRSNPQEVPQAALSASQGSNSSPCNVCRSQYLLSALDTLCFRFFSADWVSWFKVGLPRLTPWTRHLQSLMIHSGRSLLLQRGCTSSSWDAARKLHAILDGEITLYKQRASFDSTGMDEFIYFWAIPIATERI